MRRRLAETVGANDSPVSGRIWLQTGQRSRRWNAVSAMQSAKGDVELLVRWQTVAMMQKMCTSRALCQTTIYVMRSTSYSRVCLPKGTMCNYCGFQRKTEWAWKPCVPTPACPERKSSGLGDTIDSAEICTECFLWLWGCRSLL